MQRTFSSVASNRQQREILSARLDMCRELSNAALQEPMESYKITRKAVTWLPQQSPLPAIQEARPEFKNVPAHTLQAVLIRLNRSFPKLLSQRGAGLLCVV
jgi:hypothetical protein